MDRITPRELVRPSIVNDRSAFDLQALAFLVGAVLTGVFVILFLLAFLPWLLAGALTAAVESLMRQVGFSKFTVDSIGDWVLVLVVGAVAVAILVAAVTAIAGVANLLSYSLTSRRDRGPRPPGRSQVASRDRGANGAAAGPLLETRPYEERTVDELYAEARWRNIPGRSHMNKAQLIRALRGQ
ncbi:MAG TPA: hypothetical protein VGO28_04150 [Acidimicrobiia bacterium]|jgi:hypothetical protein